MIEFLSIVLNSLSVYISSFRNNCKGELKDFRWGRLLRCNIFYIDVFLGFFLFSMLLKLGLLLIFLYSCLWFLLCFYFRRFLLCLLLEYTNCCLFFEICLNRMFLICYLYILFLLFLLLFFRFLIYLLLIVCI